MAMERAFGMLKCRWRILLKRVHVPLRHMPDLVTACICLYNLCIIHANDFDIEWAKVAEWDKKRRHIQILGTSSILIYSVWQKKQSIK